MRAVLAGDHLDVTVLMIDNDAPDDVTAGLVERWTSPRVRYLRGPRRGASAAGNRNLREATTPLVAFTDDDTEPDRHWATRIAGSFAADPTSAGVTGSVLAARLATPVERAAETALGWNSDLTARRFARDNPPAGSAIFPFCRGLFGIGTNLAARADIARAIGGFDEALGPGTPTRSGEDCELIVRLVLAGHVISHEPGTYVWPHHRSTVNALRGQVRDSSVGLRGYLSKIALDPPARAAALRRLPGAVWQLRQITARDADTWDGSPGCGRRARLRGLTMGPWLYLRARHPIRSAGGDVPPLTSSSASVPPLRTRHKSLTAKDLRMNARPSTKGEQIGQSASTG